MRREVKIGIFAVVMIAAAWAGVRFLKGFDIFSRNAQYYAAYDQISGVQNASPIMMKGVKIGSVTGISFDPARSNKVVLNLTIKRQYRIPKDSEAKIFSNGLMGNKAVEITYGTSTTYLDSGDTLRSSRDRDLMDVAGSELEYFKQKFSQITVELTRTLNNMSQLMEQNASGIHSTIGNLNALTGDLAQVVSDEQGNLKTAIANLTKFSTMLGTNAPRVEGIITDLDHITSQLSEEEFAQKLTGTLENLNDLIVKMNTGEGTVGKLMNDPALYNSLEEATRNLSSTLVNLQEYPGRYVHLSLFGRDPERMKEKADQRTAKAAAKAERDSLKRLR